MPRLLPLLAPLLALACAPAVPPGVTVSRGDSADGWLEHGVELPDRGEGFVRARPGESTRFGTPRLVEALRRAFASVKRTFPATPPMRVGDLSYPRGGRHPRHGSHRSGRDADLIFYATDLEGRPVQGRGWVAYDRFGVGVEPEEHGGRTLLFDDARNWHFVRTLLLDEDAQVQWIFVSRGVKSRLLRFAAAHEPDEELLVRAAWVLHQPTGASPHADHFHVRVACGPEQRALGCRDRGPMWSWWRDEAIKRVAPHEVPALDDGQLLQALLGGPPEGERHARAYEPGAAKR